MADAREHQLNEWMARLSMGDRDAFSPLFRALLPRALRLARMRLDASRADDVAQTALLNVFARASEFEAGRPVLPWFYAIVANTIRSALRDRSGSSQRDPDEELAGEGDPERAVIERELHEALEHAIESLGDDAADAIHAVLGRGPMPEVQSPTFRKRVSRAYARLRFLLGATR